MGCNPNPLDACGRAQFQCNNPCNHSPGCDLLPTQIDTFTTQFFGNDLGKINNNGQLDWVLPCGLDVGTLSNPRLPGESLACYFLRLFEAGIPGIFGQQGPLGLDGPCGQDAFTITLQNFTQPTLTDPYVTVFMRAGFSLVSGLPVEVQGSGYYIVEDVEPTGAALLRLTSPFSDAPAIIPAGAIVISSGLPGAVITGPQGIQGPQGPRGPRGAVGTTTVGPTGPQGNKIPTVSGYFTLPVGTSLNGSYQDLSHGTSFFGTNAGDNKTYLVVFNIGINSFNAFNVPLTGEMDVQLQIWIDGVFSSVAVGSTHGYTQVNNPSLSIGYIMNVPYLFTGALGHVRELIPYARSTMNGGSVNQATVNSIRWIQLTGY